MNKEHVTFQCIKCPFECTALKVLVAHMKYIHGVDKNNKGGTA